MRLTAKLVHVAAIVAAATGCGGAINTATNDAGGDGGTTGDGGNPGDTGSPGDSGTPIDAAPEAVVGCEPATLTVTATAAQACQVLEESNGQIGTFALSPACLSACAEAGPSFVACELPQSYANEVQSLNPDGGVFTDSGSFTLDCPTSPATVTVTCTQSCTGRLTEGYCAPDGMRSERERRAAMAYLEAVSVHAFDRLERELAAHGGTAALRRDARRARRDEVRHTAMTARLARERGGSPRLPEAPAPCRPRTLLEVAIENAVEGCVRETYGAVQGLVEAQTSPDRGIRRAMKSIAADECRHAELAWAVHAWAMPRLTEDERLEVERAMKDAIAEIAARDPRIASLLFA